MYEHSEVYQQRIDALPVGGRELQPIQRVRQKYHHREEEQQHKRHSSEREGRGVRQAFAYGQRGDCGHRGDHQREVEQRAGVARVERHPSVDVRHSDAAVFGDIAHREIARYEGVYQRGGGQQQQ